MQYGCYHCLEVCEETELVNWIGNTPVCPYCGVDSLLKNVVELRILEKLYASRFKEVS